MLRPTLSALLVLSAIACKAEPQTSAEPAAAPAATPAAAPPPVAAVVAQAPAPEPHPTVKASIASFRKDQLDECVDFIVDLNPAEVPPEKRTPEKLAERRAAYGKNAGSDKNQESILLPRQCGDQFSERPVLATCSADALKSGKEAGVTITMKARYYRLATAVESDTFMKQCLKIGGDWRATADEDAVALERRRDRMRKVEAMLADAERGAAE